MRRRDFLAAAPVAVAASTVGASQAKPAPFDLVERPQLTGDPDLHWAGDGRAHTRVVKLDGVELNSRGVLKAHTREGWVELVYEPGGSPIFDCDGNLITEIRHGVVTVEFPEV